MASVMNARGREETRKDRERWPPSGSRYLDAEAAKAPRPEQLTALDPNRLNAFEAAGQIERAIPMLESPRRRFPTTTTRRRGWRTSI
jgi:hypothetical protein